MEQSENVPGDMFEGYTGMQLLLDIWKKAFQYLMTVGLWVGIVEDQSVRFRQQPGVVIHRPADHHSIHYLQQFDGLLQVQDAAVETETLVGVIPFELPDRIIA